jgi:hypothetical protein
MPDWVKCEFTISGEEVQDVLQLIGAVGQKPKFDPNSLIPYPTKWAEMDKEFKEAGGYWEDIPEKRAAYLEKWGTSYSGYNLGGYEWCIKHWGTKWHPRVIEVQIQDEETAMIIFETPWSPPIPLLNALASKFPATEFLLHWDEENTEDQGEVSWVEERQDIQTRSKYHGSRGS